MSGGLNPPGKDSDPAYWMSLENAKEGINFWICNCIFRSNTKVTDKQLNDRKVPGFSPFTIEMSVF